MDPTITRLNEMPEEMNLDQVAYVLGRGRDFVNRAAALGRIESRADNGEGSGQNHRYVISRTAVLLYLIRSTRGERTLLLSAIAGAWPELSEWAQATAKGARLPAPGPAARRQRRALATTSTGWHPDQLALFTDTSPQ